MAKDKLIPTWLKVTALAALFVPYSVKLEKGEDNKIKKLSARSIAARVIYTAAEGDKEADLDVLIPGNAVDGEDDKAGLSFDSGAVVDGAKRFCKTATDKAKVYAKQTAAGFSEFCAKLSREDASEEAVGETADAEEEITEQL